MVGPTSTMPAASSMGRTRGERRFLVGVALLIALLVGTPVLAGIGLAAAPAQRAETLAGQRSAGSLSGLDLPGFQFREEGGIRWAFSTSAQAPTERLVRNFREALDHCRSVLGREPRTLLVINTYNYSEFARVTVALEGRRPARFVAALAFPTRGIVVLNGGFNAMSTVDQYRITLWHEVAHVVIGTAGPWVPRWYHEGLAQRLSGDRLEPEREALLARLAQTDELLSLELLLRQLDTNHQTMDIYYRQCLSFVTYLEDRFGPEFHPRLLSALERGASFDAAFREVAAVDLEEAESDWREVLAENVSFWRHIIPFLQPFSALAAICFGGFWYQRRRRRRALRRMAAEEQQLDDDVVPESEPS